VTLTATNGAGSDGETRTGYIVVSATPQPPVAGFTATPTSGTAPLVVNFTDTSTNTPTGWAWDFDNNGTTDSTAQNPQHSYAAAGTYSVTLTATNGAGSDGETRTGYIVVNPGGGGQNLTFIATADAKVSSDNPTKNYGTTTDLRVRTDVTNSWNSYLRFNVSGLTGTVTSATLRLFVTSATASGGSIYSLAPTAWSETAITWATAPAITGSPLDTRAAVAVGTWVEWNVTSAVSGNGVVELALRNAGGSGLYSSREGANDPQLVVVTGS
jgi:PKD repeat protein